MERRTKKAVDYAFFDLSVSNWYASYLGGSDDPDYDPALSLRLSVRLLEPVKGVAVGFVDVIGSDDQRGGYLSYDCDKVLHGALFTANGGIQALLSLLAAHQPILISLNGRPFRYRTAAIRSFSWHSADHPLYGYPSLLADE